MKNPTVDWYFDKAGHWQKELETLRLLVLDCLLTEELKWGVPCYTCQKRNILLLHAFKDYCAVLFFKGALLADANNILIQQTQHVQATRQIRFSGVQQIVAMETTLKAYIYEAIEVEKAGLTVALKPTAAFAIPDEFQTKLAELPALKTAFEALTPGRQRAYLLYFSGPKQAKTRASRVDSYIPRILSGSGLND